MAVGVSLAARWRWHCHNRPEDFAAIRGTGATGQSGQSGERWEEQLIEQLFRDTLAPTARAAAFRQIVELRQCTARAVGDFFEVDPQIVVLGLSLLEMPDAATRSRTKAA